MKRVPPTEALMQEWEVIFDPRVGGEHLLDELIRTAARYRLQKAVEEEVTESFGRGGAVASVRATGTAASERGS